MLILHKFDLESLTYCKSHPWPRYPGFVALMSYVMTFATSKLKHSKHFLVLLLCNLPYLVPNKFILRFSKLVELAWSHFSCKFLSTISYMQVWSPHVCCRPVRNYIVVYFINVMPHLHEAFTSGFTMVYQLCRWATSLKQRSFMWFAFGIMAKKIIMYFSLIPIKFSWFAFGWTHRWCIDMYFQFLCFQRRKAKVSKEKAFESSTWQIATLFQMQYIDVIISSKFHIVSEITYFYSISSILEGC